MKCYLERNNVDISLQIEKDDIPRVRKIIEMLNSDGWKEYRLYMDSIRNEIIEMGKEGIKKKSTNDLSDKKWAILTGFDISTRFIKTILDGLDEMINIENLKKQQEEVINDNE